MSVMQGHDRGPEPRDGRISEKGKANNWLREVGDMADGQGR
jgi:hypothetical protein